MEKKTVIDIASGTELTPSNPDHCKGNPECCDKCDYLQDCIGKDGRN